MADETQKVMKAHGINGDYCVDIQNQHIGRSSEYQFIRVVVSEWENDVIYPGPSYARVKVTIFVNIYGLRPPYSSDPSLTQ